MTIYEKLLTIQQELKAPKNQRNNFGNYNYRSCEDILEAAKPLLEKVKAVIIIKDKIVQKGDRYYVKATATLYDCESTGQVSANAYARESLAKKGMDDSQITGSTSSYARKYCLNGLLLIDDTKDADSQDNSQTGAIQQPVRQQYNTQSVQTPQLVKDFAKNTSKVEGGKCPDCGGIFKKGKTGNIYCGNKCWLPENAHLKFGKEIEVDGIPFD